MTTPPGSHEYRGNGSWGDGRHGLRVHVTGNTVTLKTTDDRLIRLDLEEATSLAAALAAAVDRATNGFRPAEAAVIRANNDERAQNMAALDRQLQEHQRQIGALNRQRQQLQEQEQEREPGVQL